MNEKAQFWIRHLGMEPHPEGGYFKEVYRSAEYIPAACLPARYGGPRPCSTSIYFLLEGRQTSKFHRLKSDELWHFYDGASLTLHRLDETGRHATIALGRQADRGETVQALVPAGSWFGAALNDPSSYALVGCTVSPGFDPRDFELASPSALIEKFPEHADLIQKLT